MKTSKQAAGGRRRGPEQQRKRFCVRCGRRVDLDKDLGAVELTGNLGVMCGDDVDKLIAEIYVGGMFSHHGTEQRGAPGIPRQATRHGHNEFNPALSREPRGEWL